MSKRKVWKEWVIKIGSLIVKRTATGDLLLWDEEVEFAMTPTEARRLYTKLSSDYRD